MPEITVASFNVLWGMTPDRTVPFDVVEACVELDADVLALQELWREDGTPGQAADVAAALGYDLIEAVIARSTAPPKPRALPVPISSTEGEGDWYIALLSRLPIRDSHVVALPKLRLDVAHRSVIKADLDAGGSTLSVACTHLAHLEMGSFTQGEELRAAVPPLDRPAVVLGDMNMWSWCVRLLLPGWRKAVRGATWPARFPHSQIDHILVSPSVTVRKGEVVRLLRSDHRPVRARLEVP